MKISYSIENLRTLHETPEITLRPITILVGRNSAGKSTFLRSFPLLRQSLEVRSSAPILWYGDLVDFGDFKAAVRNNDTNSEISFSFSVEDFETRQADDDYIYPDEFYYYNSRRRVRDKKVSLKVSLGEQLGRTRRQKIELTVPENGILAEAFFEKDGQLCSDLIVNDVPTSELLPGYSIYFRASNVFDKPALTVVQKLDGKSARRFVSPGSVVMSRIAEVIRPYVDKRIGSEKIMLESRRMLTFPRVSADALDELITRSDTKSFRKLYERWSAHEQEEVRSEIDHLLALNSTISAIGRVGSVLTNFFRSTTYLGPARARSERYYRHQELEVSEISPDGQNLPIFLASLTTTEQRRFSEWVNELFGFGVSTERHEGHISLQLEHREMSVNVADTGYGVSQLLPVLAQIWWSTYKQDLRRRSFGANLRPITMEQPELHLHPAHQAKLADVFASAIKMSDERKSPSVFIIETHSEALINRLGELIEEGMLSAEDVQVIIFSADESGIPGRTKISTSPFTEEGVLCNWPYGFFNYQ